MTNKQRVKFLIFGFILGVVLFFAGRTAITSKTVFASVSSFTASSFSQFCASHSTLCSKNEKPGKREGIVSCPLEGQVINEVYVHAGNGQIVFQLPDNGYTETFSSNHHSVTVDVKGIGKSHPDLSWVAVLCSVTSTPTPTLSLSPTPSASPSPTPCIDKDHDWKKDNDDNCETTPSPTPTPSIDPCQDNIGVAAIEIPFVDNCITPTVTPTPSLVLSPTPTQSPCTENCGNSPTFTGSSTLPPVCGNGNTIQLPANPFVVRKGSQATVNFFITQGDSANIYYRIVGQKDWQFSVPDITPNGDKFVSYTIQGLDPKLGYEFGIQQKFGCGGGQLVTAVIVDGPSARTFTFSYWEWSK